MGSFVTKFFFNKVSSVFIDFRYLDYCEDYDSIAIDEPLCFTYDFQEKERSTYQILEEIEDKIRKIEEFSGQYQIKQKRFVRNVLLYGIGSSIIALVIFYFAFLPNSTDEKIYFYSIGVLVFPLMYAFKLNLPRIYTL